MQMLHQARVWVVPLDYNPVFFEPCSKTATCVGSITTPTWDMIDHLASLWMWDGVLNVNQVGTQGTVGLVGNFRIVWIEASGY